ncbi:hydantoinase/oxoprolinase family protein [Candidatus Solirubrobacter pratensis]|uniref:hydantoinase/oxoprolinase family protein n=1 Tax=Candidatus Solirubrobacter pratensis TaxID=1298857 RepID=UPI000421C17E|nr:hydantoinase/oxoprolinase family protein [Candidatus Solirubrobacter pratensis]
MTTRLGVDVGGTFTDLIFYDEASGETRVAKAPTTPASPEQGILHAIAAGVPAERLSQAEFFLHGTTVGLNALLERRGAVVGLLATEGFRDVLEIRRGDRAEMYDLFWRQPEPLVPRRLRVPVRERLYATGAVHTPIVLDDVRAAAATFKAEGCTAVAIAFLHAYANDEHELAAAQALREAGFEGEISLSHQVSGEYREYERTTTTVIDAFVRGRMANYLGRLGDALADRGFGGASLVTRSGGGAFTFAEAAERPFETIMSGPVAGAEGASEVATAFGYKYVITADVGGTSFDTCLITDGRPTTLYEGEVVGLPVQTPWVDVRSIGAGGGSIAYVDQGGLLRVGPRSAGAVPGPACYGRGGTEPTVTDAALLLGMLGDGELAGEVRLDREAAERAVAPLAAALGFSAEEVARGILTIANANMAGAIREITVEQGTDPRSAVLMPFGGAGPLFLSLLASELEIGEILLPPYAGNFSAWGLLGADLTQTVARTRITPLTADGLADANALLAELYAEVERRAAHAGSAGSQRETALDMRYVGQEHTLTVLAGDERGAVAATPEEVRERFRAEYEQTFGLRMDEAVEIVSLRATIRTPLPRRSAPTVVSSNGAGHDAEPAGTTRAYSFAAGEWTDFAVIQRDGLEAGARIAGPAILLEETATAYIDGGFSGRVHESGAIVLKAEAQA